MISEKLIYNKTTPDGLVCTCHEWQKDSWLHGTLNTNYEYEIIIRFKTLVSTAHNVMLVKTTKTAFTKMPQSTINAHISDCMALAIQRIQLLARALANYDAILKTWTKQLGVTNA